MTSRSLKLRACDRCSSIKQVCDRRDEGSCSRCTRLELPCVITRAHKPMGRPRKNCPSISPHTNSRNPTGSNSSAGSLESDRHLAKPKRVQRTRSGCVMCKQRRKKCDEAIPSCGDCLRLGLACERASLASRSNGARRPASVEKAPVVRVLSHVLTSLYPNFTQQEQHLLRHYVHAVSRSLSVVPDEINAFVLLFVPMALQQPATRNALFGLSATHLKRVHPEYSYAAVEYQSRAISRAHTLLRRQDSDGLIEGLAAILFLCMQEICEGGSRQWALHLEAAVTLINNRGGPTAFPPSVQFLIESVAYFDSIATLSLCKSAYLDQQFYLPSSNLTLPSPSNIPAHALFGTAHALFAIIADISQLSQVQHARYSSPTSAATFLRMSAELELQLQEWAPAASTTITSDPGLYAKVTSAGVMLQWAALMRLHLIVSDSADISHPKVRVAVQNILTALDTIPEGDLVESMLVFPIFAAGFGAVAEDEKELVRKRLIVMERSIGFGNVFDAHETVEEIWRRRQNGVQCVWEDVAGGVMKKSDVGAVIDVGDKGAQGCLMMG